MASRRDRNHQLLHIATPRLRLLGWRHLVERADMARGQHHRIHAEDRQRRNRHLVAQEAARLISEHGMRDFRQAKRKAASRLGIGDEQHLPRNREIEDALREHQRIFRATEQPETLTRYRQVALEAMRFLAQFEPRLTGPVLAGTGDTHSVISLLLHCDDTDAVGLYLDEHGIRHDNTIRQLRIRRDETAEVPLLRFVADEVPVELTVLPWDGLRQAPLDPLTGQPMARATLNELECLIAVDPRE